MNDLTKLDWFPLYIHRIKASETWRLEDFQWCWMMKLLIELADAESPGYLPNDMDVLWRLAGARTREFFLKRGGPGLVDREFRRTADGLRIYNPRLLAVLQEQNNKLWKKKEKPPEASLSLSLNENNSRKAERERKPGARAKKSAAQLHATQGLVAAQPSRSENNGSASFAGRADGAGNASQLAAWSPTDGPAGEGPAEVELNNLTPAPGVWEAIAKELARRVTPHSFNVWLKPLRGMGARGTVLYVRVPAYEFSFVGRKFRREIAESMSALKLPFSEIRTVTP